MEKNSACVREPERNRKEGQAKLAAKQRVTKGESLGKQSYLTSLVLRVGLLQCVRSEERCREPPLLWSPLTVVAAKRRRGGTKLIAVDIQWKISNGYKRTAFGRCWLLLLKRGKEDPYFIKPEDSKWRKFKITGRHQQKKWQDVQLTVCKEKV